MPIRIECKKGSRFWMLTAIWEAKWVPQANWYDRRMISCVCDCWKEKIVSHWHLRTGHTYSCWCNKIKVLTRSATKHWLCRTKIYKVWASLKDRCINKNKKGYKDYGWRWIKNEWNSFEEFYKDMWNSYKEGLSIDRIDNNWNYSKNNCRWATSKQQARNKRNNRLYKWKCIAQWCEDLWLNYWTIRVRISTYNWPIEKALELTK